MCSRCLLKILQCLFLAVARDFTLHLIFMLQLKTVSMKQWGNLSKLWEKHKWLVIIEKKIISLNYGKL